MLKNSPRRIGEIIEVEIEFDPSDRTIDAPPKLIQALKENEEAKKAPDQLTPSRRKEIIRYLLSLKREKSIERNVTRVINLLFEKDRFAEGDKP